MGTSINYLTQSCKDEKCYAEIYSILAHNHSVVLGIFYLNIPSRNNKWNGGGDQTLTLSKEILIKIVSTYVQNYLMDVY